MDSVDAAKCRGGYPYFEVEREWVVKRTGERRLMNRDIRCVYVDEKTGASGKQ